MIVKQMHNQYANMPNMPKWKQFLPSSAVQICILA